MDITKQTKIDRFLKDELMSQSVFDVIRKSFLKNKGVRDVQIMAAERLALEFLDVAWQDLSKYKLSGDTEKPVLNQVGL